MTIDTINNEHVKYHELLELCFKAKEKGHDCFFDYSPHIECITVDIYEGKYFPSKKTKKFSFYIDHMKYTKGYGFDVALEAISYLSDLIKEV